RAWVSIPNPNGLPLIATATSDKTVRVYSLRNFTLHSMLEGGHSRSVRSVAWQPAVKNTGTLCLATGSFDATMGIWRRREERFADNEDSDNDDDWEFAIVLEGHDSEVKNVAYSPSGQWLASCSRDKSIWIWEEIGDEGDDEFETVAVLQEHTADVKCVSWRKDDGNGEILASGSYDDTIRFFKGDDEGEWSCISTLEGHAGTVWSLDWEPEVSQKQIPRLLSSSADCTIRVWSKTWECTATLPTAHDLPIYSVSWGKKTGRVVSTGGDGKIVIYEERTKGRTSVGGAIEREWVIVGVLAGGHGPYEINHVTWCTRFDSGKTADGEEMIVTTGDDGVVRAWAL
ncbi:WD40 repeat-like protein, partial [Hyaloscypha variabilis F]